MSVDAWAKVKRKAVGHWSTWMILSNASRVGKETRGRKVGMTLMSLTVNGKDERDCLRVVNVRKVRRESVTQTWEGKGSLID